VSTFKHNMVKARSALVFLIGLTLAFWLVYSLEKWNPEHPGAQHSDTQQLSSGQSSIITFSESTKPNRVHRKLNALELQWAQTAWRYFENNYVPENGFVNSADKYPAATMWDTSSYLLGLIAARRLDIVNETEFDTRVSTLLKTLASMPLFEQQLPNKSYNANSIAMVTYDNEETARGIGWSAIDIGRVMVPLNVLVWHFPEHTAGVGKVLAHWKIQLSVIRVRHSICKRGGWAMKSTLPSHSG